MGSLVTPDMRDFCGEILLAGRAVDGRPLAGYAISPVTPLDEPKPLDIAEQKENREEREYSYRHMDCKTHITPKGDYIFEYGAPEERRGKLPLHFRKITKVGSGYGNGGPKTHLMDDNSNRLFAANFDIKLDTDGGGLIRHPYEGTPMLDLTMTPEGFAHLTATTEQGSCHTEIPLRPGYVIGIGSFMARDGATAKYAPNTHEGEITLFRYDGTARSVKFAGMYLPISGLRIGGNKDAGIAQEIYEATGSRLAALSVALFGVDEWNVRVFNEPELLGFARPGTHSEQPYQQPESR